MDQVPDLSHFKKAKSDGMPTITEKLLDQLRKTKPAFITYSEETRGHSGNVVLF